LGYLHLLVPLGDSAGSAFGDLELSDGSKLKVLSPPQGSASKELEDRLWREQQVYKDDLFADSGDDIPRTFVYLEYSARARLPLAVSYDKQRLLERIRGSLQENLSKLRHLPAEARARLAQGPFPNLAQRLNPMPHDPWIQGDVDVFVPPIRQLILWKL